MQLVEPFARVDCISERAIEPPCLLDALVIDVLELRDGQRALRRVHIFRADLLGGWFVLDPNNQVVGFMGWAVTSKDKAEAWVEGRGPLSHEDSLEGDCIIFNAWAASSLEVNRFLLGEARKIMQGKDMVYFKRHYNDGTKRAGRLRINAFVGQHLERTGDAAA